MSAHSISHAELLALAARLSETMLPGEPTRNDNQDYAEVCVNNGFQAMCASDDWANYLVSANPQTVKALVERIIELEKRELGLDWKP